MKIAVIGLGKIGLPLAAQFAESGHSVVGVDIDQRTVDAVNSAREPFPGEAHLGDYLARLVPAGTLRATTSYAEAIPDCDVIVVVVPLFVDARRPARLRLDGQRHEARSPRISHRERS